ncbi:hypothetical protein OIU76_013738 [Salix suchowensis]|nr:hypothetical protein OIU76_013738 [Salix suchowensis]
MVQWVGAGRDEALFDSITRIDLTSSCFLVLVFPRERVFMLLLVMFLKWGEVKFAGKNFSTVERFVKREEEKGEPENVRDFRGHGGRVGEEGFEEEAWSRKMRRKLKGGKF